MNKAFDQLPEKKKAKIRKFAIFMSWVMRAAAFCCFLYGGTVAAKGHLPGMIQSVKDALTNDSMDPVALFKMEQAKQKALEEEKRRAKAASAKMARGPKDDLGVNDDPYQYVAGGKKADGAKDDAAKAGEGAGAGKGNE